MPASIASSHEPVPTPPPAGPDPVKPGAVASLRALLAEVAALANQLRKTRVIIPRQNNAPTGGWTILQDLDHLGPQTVPDLARSRGLSRQNIQIQVNRLESQAYVAVAPNPAHKRSGLVELTDRGRALLATLTEREASSLEGLLAHVPQARLVPAARLLHRVRELLAGTKLPPAEVDQAQPVSEPTAMPRRTARRRQATPAATGLPAAPGPSEPDEGELPFNLL